MGDWVFVCATSQLLPGEMTTAWDGDTAIAVFNHDGAFYALEDRCSHEDFELSLSATAILLDVELSAFDVELTGWRDSTRSELNPYTFVSTQDMLSDQGVSVVDDEYVKHRRFAILASATGGNTHYFRFTNLGSTPCKPKVTITYLALQ